MSTVLITGANRGIGLEFARQYSADGWDVTATAREWSDELDELGVRVEKLDLSDADSVAVNTPERMPVMMITTTNRPGNDATNDHSTTSHPGNLPAG